MLYGPETCDDSAAGGCSSNCTGPNTNFTCSGGSTTTPSICSCLTGFSKVGTLCLPVCGDAQVVGNEVCDDGN